MDTFTVSTDDDRVDDLYATLLRDAAEKENMRMYQIMMGDAFNTSITKRSGLRRKHGLDFNNS